MTTWSLVLQPQGWTMAAPSDRTLREAAERAGVELVTSCRNGTCRTCICRMRAGAVRYELPWPGLSAEEKREGYLLPCVAYPVTNVEIDAPTARRMAEPFAIE